MPSTLVDIVTATPSDRRDASLDEAVADLPLDALLAEAAALDRFFRGAENLYERVRALFFLDAIHRFHVPTRGGRPRRGTIPYDGVRALFARRFLDAVDRFRAEQERAGLGDALASALAEAYRGLAFQTLADQVRRSVRSVDGNRWMFAVERAADHPLRVRPELLAPDEDGGLPVLVEETPVRMDLTHSGWSDIFFLGMDAPEAAKVLNVSIDLAVRGRDVAPRPPISTWLRVLDRPVLRLASLDLGAEVTLASVADVFDFARDHLGLLRAAVIAAGVVPPSLEGTGARLDELLAAVVGEGRGLEVVSHVHGIPKGSRLAVSTNLLASLIALLMRATGQTGALEGPLADDERRLIVARAILGEWLGGSGGGWQDSGGLWPGIKRIEGAVAREGDPEHGSSRGRLLPDHHLLGEDEVPAATRRLLQESLVLVHGGLAQDVGPILEMVTERYLLRTPAATAARRRTLALFDELLAALKDGDVERVGRLTHENFEGPITTIIPWATNAFTEALIDRVRARFGDRFWGFWMLGGMSGGGMGLLFDPRTRPTAEAALGPLMRDLKHELEHALPFAMDPVVYEFAIDEVGTSASLRGGDAPLPPGYYAMRVPRLVRADPASLTPAERLELRRFGRAVRTTEALAGMPRVLFDAFLPEPRRDGDGGPTLDQLLAENGFDEEAHEEVRADLKGGRIGLARNRLPSDTAIEDVEDGDVLDAATPGADGREWARLGEWALKEGKVGVVTLAAGLGSRWTRGAGVVKALHPFARLGGAHRTFLEVHLAKSRRTARRFGAPPPHVVTTSYLTHAPIEASLAGLRRGGRRGPLHLSPGRSIGLRLVPMVRDLRFEWEETAQPLLDAQAQKVRESAQAALIDWARATGEASDYRDNVPTQCLHPVGHWFEIPNLLLNGTLAALLADRPGLTTLLLHNVDTLGADLDPTLLGRHLAAENDLTFEVVPRRVEDRGGGLARVNGRVRLVESLALPREEDEFRLSYYNSMSTWIDVDGLLRAFDLARDDLADRDRVAAAVRRLARRMPTYVTLKDVKKRWGHGHEDVFPVAQFEKLWSDMSSLDGVRSGFAVVPRTRGQQLKEVAQLDPWLRDGSAAAVEALCDFD